MTLLINYYMEENFSLLMEPICRYIVDGFRWFLLHHQWLAEWKSEKTIIAEGYRSIENRLFVSRNSMFMKYSKKNHKISAQNKLISTMRHFENWSIQCWAVLMGQFLHMDKPVLERRSLWKVKENIDKLFFFLCVL